MRSGGFKKRTNRLIAERSPYLQQHAHNPVEWYPWGDEAFERAAREGKPIFLSIGYSACHWCHVMGRESFEDAKVAKLLNEGFISVKVDREERPDIDALYIRACQTMTGSAGWPLTIFMTPDKKPFFAATYIPRQNSYGRLGLLELLPRVMKMWESKRPGLLRTAEELSLTLVRREIPHSGGPLGDEDLENAYRSLAESFDALNGGFGSAPKFPTPHNLTFLMRYHRRTKDPKALAMVEKTLDSMRIGGIHDHVGGGFHRYSTDASWRVPHFEKMLYDQALISMAYLECHQLTGRDEFARVAESTLDYIARDLSSADGGFVCSEGAESRGVEGAYYAWSMKELRRVLDDRAMRAIRTAFGIGAEGGATADLTVNGESAYILSMRLPVEEISARHAIDPGSFRSEYERALDLLRAERQRRERPLRDDKVLADWNGLAVVAMAQAHRVRGHPRFLKAARRAAEFVLGSMRVRGGRLVHSLRDQQEPVPAFADDYAFMIWGLIELYQSCFEARYLEAAIELDRVLMNDYRDEFGGLFTTSINDDALPVRISESFDGATPSANSVHFRNLIMLSRITGEPTYERQAEELMLAFSAQVRAQPAGHTSFLSSLDCALGPALDVIVSGRLSAQDMQQMLATLRRPYIPDMLLMARDEGDRVQTLAMERVSPFAAKCESLGGQATAYVCRGRACLPPTTSPDEALAALSSNG